MLLLAIVVSGANIKEASSLIFKIEFTNHYLNEVVKDLEYYKSVNGFYPDSLSLALNIVSKPVVALQKTNFESTSPLQIAAFDPDSLHQALSLIALENRPALIFRPNLEGKTLLQFASYRKATLLVLLALAPKDVKGVLCLLLTLFKIANNNQPQRIMPHRFFEYDNNDNRLLANTMFDRLIEQPNFEAMKIESEAFLQMHPESSFILS